MSINENRIRNRIKNFSFPRLSGTEFEEKASKLAQEEIKNMGLEPQLQQFQFSTFYSRVYPKITFPLILSLNTTNNNSKGVVDDASGVACVLELLNHYSEPQNRLKGFTFWFVLTGAEETGTMGIRNFYNIISEKDTETSLVNNFESLGKSVAVFISKNNLENNPSYYNYFEEKAEKYNFRTQVSSVSRGVHTDGIYLFQKGFNLFEFGSTDVGKYMHSKFDTLENVDAGVLKKLCKFLVELLEETQKRIKK
jgi:putative aminopeptidase FrvX